MHLSYTLNLQYIHIDNITAHLYYRLSIEDTYYHVTFNTDRQY